MSRSPGIAAIQQRCIEPGFTRGVPVDWIKNWSEGWVPFITAELTPVGWAWMASQWNDGGKRSVRVLDWGVAGQSEFERLCAGFDPASRHVGCAGVGNVPRARCLPGVRIEDLDHWGPAVWGIQESRRFCRLGLWAPMVAVTAAVADGRVRLPRDAGDVVIAALAQLRVEQLDDGPGGTKRHRIDPACTTDFTRNLARAWGLSKAYLLGGTL